MAGTQAAILPAHRPSFRPVPLLCSASDVNVVCTPTSKQSRQDSLMSSSSQLSREDASSEQDASTCLSALRQHLSPAHAAADGTLCREESRDSGCVFVTPPPSSSPMVPNLEPEFNTALSSDLPTTSLVNVGRKLFGRLNDNGDVEYRRKDLVAGFVSQNSSPGDGHTNAAEALACEQSADDLPDALLACRTNCSGRLYRRADEEFVAPSKPKKKTKSRRSSHPGQASFSSTKSLTVYGGNPKWVWKS